jgi:hypothetical protein
MTLPAKVPAFVERLLRDKRYFGCTMECRENDFGCSRDGIGCGCRCDCECHHVDLALAFLRAVLRESKAMYAYSDKFDDLLRWAESDEETST